MSQNCRAIYSTAQHSTAQHSGTMPHIVFITGVFTIAFTPLCLNGWKDETPSTRVEQMDGGIGALTPNNLHASCRFNHMVDASMYVHHINVCAPYRRSCTRHRKPSLTSRMQHPLSTSGPSRYVFVGIEAHVHAHARAIRDFILAWPFVQYTQKRKSSMRVIVWACSAGVEFGGGFALGQVNATLLD